MEIKDFRGFYETKEWQDLFDDLRRETIEEAVVRHHRNCGEHSNIPPCCVDFFIKYWRGRIPVSVVGTTYRFLQRCMYPKDKVPAYVPCPKCIIKRHAHPLHECNWQDESVPVGECKPTGRVLGFSISGKKRLKVDQVMIGESSP